MRLCAYSISPPSGVRKSCNAAVLASVSDLACFAALVLMFDWASLSRRWIFPGSGFRGSVWTLCPVLTVIKRQGLLKASLRVKLVVKSDHPLMLFVVDALCSQAQSSPFLANSIFLAVSPFLYPPLLAQIAMPSPSSTFSSTFGCGQGQ